MPNDIYVINYEGGHPDQISVDFNLLRVLGEGGYAKVYLAIEKKSNKTVAYKTLKMD